MFSPIWSCLPYDRKLALMHYQRANHNKRWQPPSDKTSQSVPAVRVQDDGEQLHPDIVPRIMQALPEDVTHNRGVFKV